MMRIFSYPGYHFQRQLAIRPLLRRGSVTGALMALSFTAGCTFPPPLADRSSDSAAEQESPRYVIVQPGENVSIIADRTGIPSRAIIDQNDLREPFTVYPGQQLTLPQAQFHRVDSGETLYRIAQNYEVDVDAVAQANQLDTPYTIFVGQSLRIPEAPGRQSDQAPDQQVAADSGSDEEQSSDSSSGWRNPERQSTSSESGERQPDGEPRVLTPTSSSSTSSSGDRSVRAEQLDEPSAASQETESGTSADDTPDEDSTGSNDTSDRDSDDAAVPAEADVTAQPVEDVEDDEEAGQTPEPATSADPTPTPEETETVNQEQANLPAVSAPAERSGDRFTWPLDGQVISEFGPKDDGQHNDGINIDAARGTPIRAADNGVVAYAGSELRGYGNLIILRHADGWVTAYGHADRITVQRGESVSVGDTIGEVGSTGTVSSPQLHFEIRRESTPVDPMDHLAPRG